MGRALHKLSDISIRTKDLPIGRYGDGGGLYLYVSAKGRSWVYVGIRNGKRIERGLGGYPQPVSLAQARAKAAECRARLQAGLDPVADRNSGPRSEPTFGECADEYIAEIGKGWSNAKHRSQWSMTLSDAYCKRIRHKPASEVSTEDVLAILKPVWITKPETAQRLRGRIERVLFYAKAKGIQIAENPAQWRGHLEHLLARRQRLVRGHHAAMPYSKLPEFMTKLRASQGMSARALEFLVLTAGRSGEVLGARWQEIDMEQKLWVIPATRMKARKVHRVPLSDAALDILKDLFEARAGDCVFLGQPKGGIERPLSVMALTMQMRRMNVGSYTPHGFRSSFRDWAGDQTNFPREIAEAALAHKVGDETERAYRRADALDKRRTLMDAWAAYINDVLPEGQEKYVGTD